MNNQIEAYTKLIETMTSEEEMHEFKNELDYIKRRKEEERIRNIFENAYGYYLKKICSTHYIIITDHLVLNGWDDVILAAKIRHPNYDWDDLSDVQIKYISEDITKIVDKYLELFEQFDILRFAKSIDD